MSTREKEESLQEATGSTPVDDVTHEKRVRVAQVTQHDRSCYRGDVNEAEEPNGVGVVYTVLGTHIYAGTVTSDRSLGVQLWPNGTLFAGEFQNNYPHGDAVKRDPFGSQFVGQWREGELNGMGLSVNVDGEVSWGEFKLNELDDTSAWNTIQPTVLRALLVEQHALEIQERARTIELEVLLQGLSTVANESFQSPEEIQQFSQEEEKKLRLFLDETKLELEAVEAEGNKWKLKEAQLKEKQKKLRREITEARSALAYTAKYVGLAETREAQFVDAERTLKSLNLQIENMEHLDDPTSNEPQEEEKCESL